MQDESVIPYLDTCTHLGNVLCTSYKHVMIESAVKILNCRLICLLISLIMLVTRFPPSLIYIA